MIPVSQWSWELNTEDRLMQAHLLEKKYKELLAKLNEKRNHEIEVAREEYHKSKVRAKSRVYESKTVIGGTIVGCIGRFVLFCWIVQLNLYCLKTTCCEHGVEKAYLGLIGILMNHRNCYGWSGCFLNLKNLFYFDL